MPMITSQQWDEFLKGWKDHHLLQSSAWAQLKSGFGWQAEWVLSENGQYGAQVLFRRLPGGLSWGYLPKGPVGGDQTSWEQLWPGVDALCRRHRAVFLKVEPDLWQDKQPETMPVGFQRSPHSVQPLRTLRVNLVGDEETLLGRMKQKTRYNVRLAQRKGVRIHPSQDLQVFHDLMNVTGGRDGFGVHSLEYYQKAYELFHSSGQCELLVAEIEGKLLAALMVFAQGSRAWYFYGASSNEARELMPTYLIQWEAMCWARSMGCTEYDLWGVPDEDEYTLEAQFAGRQDGLWGVYRFKRGFGGSLARAVGPWDRVYNWPIYWVYLKWFARRASE